MNRGKKISVIIPAFNSARYLPEAISSVLNQTVPAQEIIVVDDGSVDDTESVVESFEGNVRYAYQKNAGVAAARNKGLEISTGDLITFIDADDVWLKNKLELQLQLFQQNNDLEMVIGFLQRVYKCDDKESLKVYDGDEEGIFVLQLGSTLIQKSLFERVGNFDEEMAMSEDFDWFLRTRESDINVEVHRNVVQLYRQHDRNTTKNRLATNRFILKAFKKSLDRRRKTGLSDFKIPSLQSNLDEILNFWNYKDQKEWKETVPQ